MLQVAMRLSQLRTSSRTTRLPCLLEATELPPLPLRQLMQPQVYLCLSLEGPSCTNGQRLSPHKTCLCQRKQCGLPCLITLARIPYIFLALSAAIID